MDTRALSFNVGLLAGMVLSFVFTPWAGIGAVILVAIVFFFVRKDEAKNAVIGGVIGVLIGLAMYLTLDRIIIFG